MIVLVATLDEHAINVLKCNIVSLQENHEKQVYLFNWFCSNPASNLTLHYQSKPPANDMNPFDSPQSKLLASTAKQPRLDWGVLLVSSIIFVGFLASVVGAFSPTVQAFLMPRFGWVGLFLSLNVLMFIGFWISSPTRRGLLVVSFMTLSIGVINGIALIRSGTVDSVQNVFHDRIHSAWIWSVVSYLCAGCYFVFAAFRNQSAPGQHATDPEK